MKLSLITLILSLCLNSLSQSTIYVNSNKDKRYVAYIDSMNQYRKYEAHKKSLYNKLNACVTFTEYDRIVDSIKKGKSLDYSIKYEKLITIYSRNKRVAMREFWIGVTHIKPTIKVIYKPKEHLIVKYDTIPTKTVNIIYTYNGQIDSINKLIVKQDYHF